MEADRLFGVLGAGREEATRRGAPLTAALIAVDGAKQEVFHEFTVAERATMRSTAVASSAKEGSPVASRDTPNR